MNLLEYLIKEYNYNEPIFVNELSFENYSRPWLFKELKKLVDTGALKRFDVGIYYLPKKMPWGDSFPDSYKVVEKRFLSDANKTYGYVSGLTLLNRSGLTTQMPNMVELVTNNETTRVRDLKVGGVKVRARRARTVITNENVNTLQFLDLMNAMSVKTLGEDEKFMLNRFVRDSGVTLNSVTKYASLYPAQAMKNMIESGVINEIT